MLRVSDLIGDIMLVAGGDVFPARVITVFNECLQRDLAATLMLETESIANVFGDGSLRIAKPPDAMEMISLQIDGQVVPLVDLNSNARGYRDFGGAFEIQGYSPPLTVVVKYYRYPARIVTVDDVPDVPPEYLSVLRDYYLAQHFQETAMPQRAKECWEAYYRGKGEIYMQARMRLGSPNPKLIEFQLW